MARARTRAATGATWVLVSVLCVAGLAGGWWIAERATRSRSASAPAQPEPVASTASRSSPEAGDAARPLASDPEALACGVRSVRIETPLGDEAPDGELSGFECVDLDGRVRSIELASPRMQDGAVELVGVGTVRVQSAAGGGYALVPRLTADQTRLLRATLAERPAAARPTKTVEPRT